MLTPRWSSTEELPNHGHGAVTDIPTLYGESSWEKNGYGGANTSTGIVGCRDALLPQFNAEAGGTAGTGHSATISVNATHGHTITISATGNDQSHENRQPYVVIYRFRRIN